MSSCGPELNTGISFDEFLVLNYVSIVGVANTEMIEAFLLKDSKETNLILTNLITKKYIEKSEDYFKITGEGEKVIKRYYNYLKSNGCLDKATNVIEKLEMVNDEIKNVITQWQIRKVGDTIVINDHQDPAYDERVINRLCYVGRKASRLLAELSNYIPHFNHYIKLLDKALDKVMSGMYEYVDRHPQSYHNIWYICHEDWLRIFNMKRKE